MAFADDVAKKRVGRSEEELFGALEHSDRVLDEELARGGWKRNMDKREVVPTLKGKRPGFDLAKKRARDCGRSAPLRRTFYVEWQQSGGTAVPKESDTHSVAVHGQILDGEEPLAQEMHHLWLQGARSCSVGRRDLCVARFGDAGDQCSAVSVHESDAPKPCKNGGERASAAVVESAAPPALADSSCIGVAVRRVGWLQAMLRDESCATASCDFWLLLGERRF